MADKNDNGARSKGGLLGKIEVSNTESTVLTPVSRIEATQSSDWSEDTDINHRPSRGSYQSIRHLEPKNISPLKVRFKKDKLGDQLRSLQQVNRLTPLKPPFVHRPNSRYLSSLLLKS